MKAKAAIIEFEKEQKELQISEVLRNLHKPDSLKVLLAQYEGSLHKADHIRDSPRENNKEDLLLPSQEPIVDMYTSTNKGPSLKYKRSDEVGKVGQKNGDQKLVDMDILRFTQRVRYEQSWLNPVDKLDVDDFDGDEDAFLEAKIE